MAPRRVTVLVSGGGSNLQALLDAPRLGGRVVAVVADTPAAGGLQRADKAGVPAFTVDYASFPQRAAWEDALAETVARSQPDLVVLAGFMRILSGAFVARWPMFNVHPSLLPAFPGADAVGAALGYGVKVTGVTVHIVDEQVDHGPIVAQEAVEVLPDDTRERLHARIQVAEHRLLPECVRLWCTDRLHVEGRHVRILP